MIKGKVLLFALLLVFATSVSAGEVHDCLSTVSLSASPLHVLICPAGDFQDMGDDCGGYIMITAKDASNVGVAHIPWTDYWLNACDAGDNLFLCAGAVSADSMTNSLGQTTISDQISGGGCVIIGGISVAIQNKVILLSPGCTDPVCLTMEIKSPDLNGDGFVNLTDFSRFGNAYGTSSGDAAYDDCCDYNDDTGVGLSDFSLFGNHYQHVCQ